MVNLVGWLRYQVCNEKTSRQAPQQQDFCFQNPIVAVLDAILFHCAPDNICSHTTGLTTTMYFNWLF
jgi:hypothetical protein